MSGAAAAPQQRWLLRMEPGVRSEQSGLALSGESESAWSSPGQGVTSLRWQPWLPRRRICC
jgi:hypothetical protein